MEPLITYISDAVAFLYYLLDKLPLKADKAFKEAEEGRALLYLPTIAAAELYYLFERKGWIKQWSKLKAEMKRHTTFAYYSFNVDVLDLFGETKAREIHDKIIILTARLLKAKALVTKDEEISKLGEVKTLW
ncbi:MAG: type II toxin-antitoxin system VapC family toxin [Nitrososphaerales archaeon]